MARIRMYTLGGRVRWATELSIGYPQRFRLASGNEVQVTRVVVKFRDDVPASTMDDLVSLHKAKIVERLTFATNLVVIAPMDQNQDILDLANALGSVWDVKSAEPEILEPIGPREGG